MLDQPLLGRWPAVGVQIDGLLKLSLLRIVAQHWRSPPSAMALRWLPA